MRRRAPAAPVTILGVALAGLGLLVGLAAPAAAHPLGNFTTNTAAALRLAADRVNLRYVVDLAEIPALQAIHGLDRDGDRQPDRSEAAAYADAECARLAAGLRLAVAGQPRMLAVLASAVRFPPGQAGLRTLRLTCDLRADLPTLSGPAAVTYADANFGGRVGWREVTAAGAGVVASDVPATSPSRLLRAYPRDRLQAPPARTTATLRWDSAAPPVTAVPRPAAAVAALPVAPAGPRPPSPTSSRRRT